MKIVRVSLLLVLVCLASAMGQQRIVVLKAARLFDSAEGKMIEPGLVVVADGKIQSVGGSAVPSGATVIDLRDATLLPGFIDSHTHLSYDFDPDYQGSQLRSLQRTIPEQAIRATENARKTLMAGFTTVRDLGSQDFIDVGLRDAINSGVVPGPRMLVSVAALGSTGGHCDGGAGFRFGVLNHETGPRDGVINSPDQARYAVRFNIKYGADVIKTCASGGVLSPTDDVDVPQLTQAELDALVDEAHTLRRKAAAHSHGAEAAKRAIRAGIDSIEHGTFLDDEALNLMKQKGTYLVFTPVLCLNERLKKAGAPANVVAKATAATAAADATFKRALARGIN